MRGNDNLGIYLDVIGRYREEPYVCDLEKRWPFGPARDLPNPFMAVPDLSDASTWSDQPPGLFMKTRDELLLDISKEISNTIYYLLVSEARLGRFRIYADDACNQHKEAVRMWEFLYGHDYGMLGNRACNPRLEHLDDQSLRAILLTIEMMFENLC
jgi:hypothetical protein